MTFKRRPQGLMTFRDKILCTGAGIGLAVFGTIAVIAAIISCSFVLRLICGTINVAQLLPGIGQMLTLTGGV